MDKQFNGSIQDHQAFVLPCLKTNLFGCIKSCAVFYSDSLYHNFHKLYRSSILAPFNSLSIVGSSSGGNDSTISIKLRTIRAFCVIDLPSFFVNSYCIKLLILSLLSSLHSLVRDLKFSFTALMVF